MSSDPQTFSAWKTRYTCVCNISLMICKRSQNDYVQDSSPSSLSRAQRGFKIKVLINFKKDTTLLLSPLQ